MILGSKKDIDYLKLRLKLILIESRLVLLCELHGYVYAFRRCVDNLFEEGNLNKSNFKKLLKYIYTDYSDQKLYLNSRFPLVYLYIILDEFNLYKIARIFPANYKVVNPIHTSKLDYEKEKRQYKIYDQLTRDGYDLKKHGYEEYKLIASKYNWPFIVNSNDNTIY